MLRSIDRGAYACIAVLMPCEATYREQIAGLRRELKILRRDYREERDRRDRAETDTARLRSIAYRMLKIAARARRKGVR